MKVLILFFVLCCVSGSILTSCESGIENTTVEQQVKVDSTAKFGDSDIIFPALSAKAMDEVAQWSVFDDFFTEAKSLNNSTLAEVQARSERLLIFADSLEKKIPNALFTSPIYSRLIVVNSRVKLLHQEVWRPKLDSTQIQIHMKEFNISFQNLLIQINERLEKIDIDEQRKEDEEKELEKQKRFLDSVYKAELEDQRNR